MVKILKERTMNFFDTNHNDSLPSFGLNIHSKPTNLKNQITKRYFKKQFIAYWALRQMTFSNCGVIGWYFDKSREKEKSKKWRKKTSEETNLDCCVWSCPLKRPIWQKEEDYGKQEEKIYLLYWLKEKITDNDYKVRNCSSPCYHDKKGNELNNLWAVVPNLTSHPILTMYKRPHADFLFPIKSIFSIWNSQTMQICINWKTETKSFCWLWLSQKISYFDFSFSCFNWF